eukprot:SAG31_NODE_3867_length_3800_cov_23.537422_3_plen_108_part_00
MFPHGREALLETPSVTDSLQEVAVHGWTAEAQIFAQSALVALSGHQDADRLQSRAQSALVQRQHIMVSYQVRAVHGAGSTAGFDIKNSDRSCQCAVGCAASGQANCS